MPRGLPHDRARVLGVEVHHSEKHLNRATPLEERRSDAKSSTRQSDWFATSSATSTGTTKFPSVDTCHGMSLLMCSSPCTRPLGPGV